MFNISLRRGGSAEPPPHVNGSHPEREPLAPWSPAEGVREIRHYKVSPRGASDEGRDRLSGGLLVGAGVIIAVALIGAGYVSYDAQRRFAVAHLADHSDTSARIIAALPDAGWIAMALVALVAALRGRSSLRARIGVLLFFGLSLGAQLMYAPATTAGRLVAIIAPISLAWMLETLIIEVRRWAAARRSLDVDETPILTGVLLGAGRALRGLVGLALWMIRLLLDRRGTWGGVRDWVLDTAPLAPGRTRASLTAAAALKQATSAEQIAQQARDEATRQVAEITAAVEGERAELAERIAETERTAREAEREQAAAALAELRAALHAARDEAERLEAERQRLAALAAVPTGRARLIALYERLREAKDPRYMDRAAAAEVARELYEAAGLRSEGTARTYLYDHIKAAPAAEMSPAGGMIEARSTS